MQSGDFVEKYTSQTHIWSTPEIILYVVFFRSLASLVVYTFLLRRNAQRVLM